MTVIAMTREMGTLGKDIAYGLADTLGLRIVHHELVEHDLASRLGVQDSAVHHYLEGNATLRERWQIDKHKLSRYTAVEILELAQEGNVIVRGWGATALLKDVPHVMRVRVCAPMPFREKVMMERLGIDDRSAVRSEIERSDAAHARTMSGFFGIEWENPIHYHVTVNTGHVPPQTAIRMLRLLADDAEFQETEETRSALADKLVEWRTRTALSEHRDGQALSNLAVDVRDGNVVLTGISISPQNAALAERIARDVPGVRNVEARLVVIRSYGGV